MSKLFPLLKLIIIIQGFIIGPLQYSFAQSHLDKKVSISVTRQPLSQVLTQIGNQGNFYFSYGSDAVRSDSLITLTMVKSSVRDILDHIFGGKIRYKESENYIFLLPHLPEKHLIIAGKLIDRETQLPVDYASVYSRNLLISSLSDEKGNFRLRIKDHPLPQEITFSKIGYQDTTVIITAANKKDFMLALTPKSIDLDEVVITKMPGYRNFLLNLLVSSRLRMTSQNLGRFFVSLPYQASLTPGLGTHGKMASQIVNKVSLNLIGGYTAGVDGVELAGVFNISKTDVQYMQAAGIFNIVAGKIKGVQLAGIHNAVQDSVNGIQAAGFSNIIGGSIRGIQLSGLMNKVSDTLSGIQMAGAFNLIRGAGDGIQAAGIFNHNHNDFSGIQMAGLFNYTHRNFKGIQLSLYNSVKSLKGIQIGIVNRAEYSEGYSLGIINFIKNGNPHFSLSSTEIAPFNLSWKTGTPKLYSILTVGALPSATRQQLIWGLGLGREWKLREKITLQTEVIQSSVAQKNKEVASVLRLQVPLNYFLNNRVALFAGPAVSLLISEKPDKSAQHTTFPDVSRNKLILSDNQSIWLGGQIGLSWYYNRQ